MSLQNYALFSTKTIYFERFKRIVQIILSILQTESIFNSLKVSITAIMRKLQFMLMTIIFCRVGHADAQSYQAKIDKLMCNDCYRELDEHSANAGTKYVLAEKNIKLI